jgi:hypothetical protein
MVKEIKELGIESKTDVFRYPESLADAQISPSKPRRSKRVSSELAVLTVLRIGSRETRICTWINY